MRLEEIHKLFDDHPDFNQFEFAGKCHECKKPVTVLIQLGPDGFEITGGAVYQPDGGERRFYKCDACMKAQAQLKKYQHCQVFSRVVGYYSSLDQWNKGKKAEFYDRTSFDVSQSHGQQGLAATTSRDAA